MNIKDFVITNQIEEVEAEKFCCSCLSANPESEKGYSLCCHEDIVNKELALKFSKRRDISNFIKIKFNEVKEFGNLFFNPRAIFSFENRLVHINILNNREEIIKELKCNI